MTLRDPALDEDWSELDALVDAELDLVLARRAQPASARQVEVLFLEQATAFLARHAEPERLLAELAAQFTPPEAEPLDGDAAPPAQEQSQ